MKDGGNSDAATVAFDPGLRDPGWRETVEPATRTRAVMAHESGEVQTLVVLCMPDCSIPPRLKGCYV